MEKYKWIATIDDVATRLDKYAFEQTDDISRSRIQQLINTERILVNGKKSKSNYRLSENDIVECTIPEEVEYEVVPVKMDLDIVYEDSDIIVINKPKGIVVHPGAGTKDVTLVHGLMYHCKDLSGINGVLRPGIVHRIDKDTTGLLMVAKNDIAHQSLSKQLVDKTLSRKYVALVHGVIPHDHGVIDAPIGRDTNDRQKMRVTDKNAKNAVTEFYVKERFDGFTLVECRLQTGRTHQIRVHMQYIKHPVVGDAKYSYRKPYSGNGQLLHAYELSFIHPRTNEMMTLQAPLPVEFDEVIKDVTRKEMAR